VLKLLKVQFTAPIRWHLSLNPVQGKARKNRDVNPSTNTVGEVEKGGSCITNTSPLAILCSPELLKNGVPHQVVKSCFTF